jgi:hypothetical protein
MLRCAVFLILAMTLGEAANAQHTGPSNAELAVRPVVDAIEQAQAIEAALPPATTTREKLERLGRLDQSGRMHIQEVDWGKLSPEEGLEARKRIAAVMEPLDAANLAELRKLMPADGWFSLQEVGEVGIDASFHIVQHGDLATMKIVLPRLQAAAERGEVDGASYAKMYDRVATTEGRRQRYGTQFHCVDGRIASFPLENPDDVEKNRRTLKLSQTFADSEKMHAGRPCAGS